MQMQVTELCCCDLKNMDAVLQTFSYTHTYTHTHSLTHSHTTPNIVFTQHTNQSQT